MKLKEFLSVCTPLLFLKLEKVESEEHNLSPFKKKLRGALSSRLWGFFFFFILVINSFLFCFSVLQEWNRTQDAVIWRVINAFMVFLVIQEILHVVAFGEKYFKDGWNVTSSVLIVIGGAAQLVTALLSFSPEEEVNRVLRCFAVLPVFLLITEVKVMKETTHSILVSLANSINVLLLTCCACLYIPFLKRKITWFWID